MSNAKPINPWLIAVTVTLADEIVGRYREDEGGRTFAGPRTLT